MNLYVRLSCYFLILAFCGAESKVAAQFTANSLDELRTYAAQNNVDVTLAAGEYWLQGDGSNPNFLEFSGSNSTFNLSAGQIKLDTREMAGYGNSQTIFPITISGNNNLILGLSFEGVDVDLDTDPDSRRTADRSAVYLLVTGNNNIFRDTQLVVRGSFPYGLGDVFGKGGRPSTGGQPVEEGGTAWIHHRKTSSFLISFGATNTLVENLDLQSYAYGHGFFMQNGATNTTIRNSVIRGELCSSNDAIAHPEYQEYAAGADGILGTPDDGGTSRGTPIAPNIQLSCQEDGIRMYGNTNGLTVDNVLVVNMRSGVHSTFGSGDININNVQAYGTENAFILGSNTTITNSKADIINGPMIYVQYNGKRDSNIDVELVGGVPVGINWAPAYLNGSNFDVTIRSDLSADELPTQSVIRFGQTWFNNWRDNQKPTGPEDADPGAFTGSVFENLTAQGIVLGNLAVTNMGSSTSTVVSNGDENYYNGITVVPFAERLFVSHAAGLGNNGDASDDTLDDNATRVEFAGTLELAAGIRIADEKLTISGDGVDGLGALYTDGSSGGDTRFGSSNNSDDSTIFLDGDASIGVGIAGNRLLVGRLQGNGDLTKLGMGVLSVEKSSTFDGAFIVDQGGVIARNQVANQDLSIHSGAFFQSIAGNAVDAEDGDVTVDGELDINGRTDENVLSATVGRLLGSGNIVLSNPDSGAGGVLEIAGDSGQGVFDGVISGKIDVVKSGSSTQTFTGNNSYSGTTEILGGELIINGVHDSDGTFFVNAGRLSGVGQVAADVVLEDNSVLAPGGVGVGVLTVADVSFSATSQLEIELSGTSLNQHDRLISDSANLAGTVSVTLADGFQPEPNQQFVILAAGGAVSGTFANLPEGAVVASFGNVDLTISYTIENDSGVMLTASNSAILIGDVNSDGIVDLLDVSPFVDLIILGGYSAAADLNGDGVVDLLDVQPFVAILTGG